MRAIIIGAGKIGYNIAETLSLEGHDVFIVERDEERKKIVDENLDVQAILGNGADSKLLESIEIEKADLLIAVTENDELNMLSCMLAGQYGVNKTVARVRNPDYDKDNKLATNPALNIDLMINPERVAANEIAKIIAIPEAVDVNYFAKGKIMMLELQIEADNPIVNKILRDIQIMHNDYHFLVAAISRKEEIIIPRGDDMILAGDRIFIIGRTDQMRSIEKGLGFTRKKVNSIMIVGGSRVAFYLAQLLEKKGLEVKIIEKDYKHCRVLATDLDEAIILNGDGSDIDLLQDEGVANADLFITLTEDDKLNVLVALMAKRLNAKKTIAQVRRSDYLPLLEAVGIDVTFSPRLLAAEAVLKFLRSQDFLSISVLEQGSAEVYEILIQERMKRLINKKLRDLKFPRGMLIVAILRDNDVIIPSGEDELLVGDRIIIFTVAELIHRVEHILRLEV
ncbi:MAG: Trk system potassium transporter TrkA [Peptococcaceae bacterium]|nr:Trk system potassium transporter TrkA [Peptococcaceae bacterium]